MERAGAFVGELAGGARQADAAIAAARPHADEAVAHAAPAAAAAPAADAATGAATIAAAAPEPRPPAEVLVHELDYAGRPSLRATEAMQELVTRDVLAATTTREQATARFLEVTRTPVDDLTPDQLRQLHALMDELPDGVRVVQPDGFEAGIVARAAATEQIFPTGRSWFLGETARRIVLTRALHELPDQATALARLRQLVDVAEPSRDQIQQVRAILDGLPEERVPELVRSFEHRAEAVRQLGWVARGHGGVADGFATHQEAGRLLFALRNHVGGADEQALLGRLDELLAVPLEQWKPVHVRELANLLQHPQMPRPDVHMAWDLPEVLKQLMWASSSTRALQPGRGGMLDLITSDLRVLRQQRLGVMADRTHELAGRIVEGTFTKAELQELRMIASREPNVAAVLPDWLASPARDYRDVDHLLARADHRQQLRAALLPMIDATAPTEELRALAQLPRLSDDEAIRMVRIAGRLDAFDLQLPAQAAARLPRAVEQALLAGGGIDPALGTISTNLAQRHGIALTDELRTIAEARRIVSILQGGGSVAPWKSNVDQNVREALDVVDSLLAPGSDVHPDLRTLLERSRDILATHRTRLGGTRVANQSGVQGYASHPDYAEIGRAASNIELGAELLSHAQRSRAAASEVVEAADALAW